MRLSGIMILELLQGLVSVSISLIAFFMPGSSNVSLMLLIATWGIIIGISKIILGSVWGEEIPHKWLPKASGIMILTIGLFLIIFLRSEDISMFSSYMALYTFIFGLLLFIFALDLRALQKKSR
jgi:uncharacterized membrane protein HdeD (DUF308 family)